MIFVMRSTRRIRLSLTYICPLKCQKCEKFTDKKLVKDNKKLAKMVEKLLKVIEKLVKVIESRICSTLPDRKGWSSNGEVPGCIF